MSADLVIRDEGTIFLLIPMSDAGEEWIVEHIPENAMRFSGAVVVEHRFIADIAEGARGDGLVVEAAGRPRFTQ